MFLDIQQLVRFAFTKGDLSLNARLQPGSLQEKQLAPPVFQRSLGMHHFLVDLSQQSVARHVPAPTCFALSILESAGRREGSTPLNSEVTHHLKAQAFASSAHTRWAQHLLDPP